MDRRWTFGRRIAAGFTVMLALTVVVGVIAVLALDDVVSSKDRVIDVNAAHLTAAETLRAASQEQASAARGFFLTGEQRFVDQVTASRRSGETDLDDLNQSVRTVEERRLTDAIEQSGAAYQQALDDVIALRRTNPPVAEVSAAFEEQVEPRRDDLSAAIDAFIAEESRLLADARQGSSDTASSAKSLVTAIAVIGIALGALLAFALARTLRRQIGTAVGEVQSSSAELQATANQQATGAREQATAMNEISTTISELLVTSRQIAESAQRVAQVAEQTADAGRSGEDTVTKAHESMTDIRRQVDLIVNHMLELGEKSQQIGAVLDIVSELAEQTNILAINSTIEAAGAGESGKRFAVVADEIRKLADRVARATKEIRGLIDVVRSAVNTTIMATEVGSKAVDAGTRQFTDVASAFGEIAGLVTTTTEAAREIELSTKQQATAVEQVNVAITSVAQATQETEASSSQTFQTATQLTTLSQDLQRLVEPQAVG